MPLSRAVFFIVSQYMLEGSFAAAAKLWGSTLVVASVLAREPEWAAKGIGDPGTIFLPAFRPIFLGRREREPQQIVRSGNHTAAHAQSKRGTLEKAGRRITRG